MPKAFLSHATVDQDRFVRGLAMRLRANGVDTWYAEWALLDGDSLSDRIFEEGIGQADVVIVVVSKNSIDSNWVKAELGTARVRDIDKKCRLIPIILDGIEPPVALQEKLQRRIADPTSYDAEFDGLLRSIFNTSSAPPLGPAPTFASAPTVHGLTPADTVVFVQLSELVIERGQFLVDGGPLHARCADQGLSDAAVVEGVHMLDSRHLIKEGREYDNRVHHVIVRPRLLHRYLMATRNVAGIERQLLALIANRDHSSRLELGAIAQEIGLEPIVAQTLLDRFAPRLFKLSPRIGGTIYIDSISPLLARELN
jgi:hypothetical protein